jgi:adenylate kinase family enzyme
LRLKIYYQHEQEILDFYVDKGFKVNELDGDQGAQNLFEDFKKIVLLNYVS